MSAMTKTWILGALALGACKKDPPATTPQPQPEPVAKEAPKERNGSSLHAMLLSTYLVGDSSPRTFATRRKTKAGT